MRFTKTGFSSSALSSKVFSVKTAVKLACGLGVITLGMQALPAVAVSSTDVRSVLTQSAGGQVTGGILSGNSPESRQADELANQGVQAFSQGNHDAAFRYWQQAQALYSQANDLAGKGRMLENLSVIHRLNNSPAEALQLSQQALAAYEALGNADNQPSLYLNLGGAYGLAEQYPEAIAAYSQGLSIYQRYND